MKKILYISAVLFMALAIQSCDSSDESSFEDSDINTLTEQVIYSNVGYTRRVLLDLYGRVRQTTNSNCGSFGRLKNMATTCALLDNVTDDGAGNSGSNVPGAQKYLTGAITGATNPVTNTHPWTWYYNAIRQANGFLENVDNSVLEDSEKKTSKAEARFLRAYYYHEIYRWFGPFVISDHREDPFDYSLVRGDEKSCVEWLVNEFDELIKNDSGLQDVPSAEYYGIATRGAALAYKARTLLYAASPLHSTSGVTWAEAAQAALDMIEYADNNGYYALYEDAAEPQKSYTRLFNTRYNKEYIFWYNRADNNDLYNMFPAFNPWNLNKEISTVATQSLIDSYDMIDGSEPFVYDKNGNMASVNAASGYDETKPYDNRDPRLNQSHLHDGSVWPLVNGSPETVDISTAYNWVTGYFVTKYFDDRIDHRTGGTTTVNFPCMRYAEILLDYAEAVNEAYNTADARQKAVAQLNRIRHRAGITKDLDATGYTQETLRARIRKERRVELCWEEHRFFDIRRWKIASTVMNLPAYGMTKDASGYHRFQIDTRSYNERMDLLPLPLSEVNNCPKIYQNAGY